MIKYNGETVSEYLKKLEEYQLKEATEKYELVLEFVNDLLDLKDKEKLKSLRDFKKLLEEDICKNKTHNFKIIKNYIKSFKSKLDLTIKLKKKKNSDSDDDEVSQEVENDRDSIFVITVLQRVTRTIGFKLISKKIGSNIYYSIKN